MKFVILFLSTFLVFACSRKNQHIEHYELGQILTPKGEMILWLYDETPMHKANFVALAQEGYWDTLTFNRVIEGFVIQGGCPDTPEGFSDSPYLLEPEFREHLRHRYGSLGAGRDDNPGKLSAGCQLYIVHDKDGIERLDGNYTVYGQVIEGLSVLDAIARVDTDSLDRPVESVSMDVNIIRLTEAELADRGWTIPGSRKD